MRSLDVAVIEAGPGRTITALARLGDAVAPLPIRTEIRLSLLNQADV